MGSKDITFESVDPSAPAKFYLNSAPAHRTCPTVLIKPEGTPEDGVVIVKDCNKVELGSLESANHRTICKYILPGQVESCQLEMGMTKLEPEVCGTRCLATRMTDVWKSICTLICQKMPLSCIIWESQRKHVIS